MHRNPQRIQRPFLSIAHAPQPIAQKQQSSIGWVAINPRCMGEQISHFVMIENYSHAPYAIIIQMKREAS
ncbi:MAG: hypothetical protein EA001_14135 [Oscillatoriales cyanobacterium]|nr:MAG: hypothetical protein EA001_14135 [Oscillatoriales cyanobacterium]